MADVVDVLVPAWPAPPAVRAAQTQRGGGVSEAPWASLNLAHHVGDDPDQVAENRRRLVAALDLPAEPRWLDQVHGSDVVHVPGDGQHTADASVTTTPGVVLAVLTADCLPVLLCRADGTAVAAAHAGWRGLAAGVLENTVAALAAQPERLLAWLGPCIGLSVYEVGEEVRAAFVEPDPSTASHFVATRPGHWHADLAGLARRRLAGLGLTQVFQAPGACTFSQPEAWYSYRREGRCGRQATLIWRAAR